MKGGKLRHRITLQSKSIGVDSYGGPVETWSDVSNSIPASVEPLQGRELVAAQSVSAETTTRITMRYRAGVVATNRIIFEGKYYNLQSVVDPELKHRELIVMASEGLNEG